MTVLGFWITVVAFISAVAATLNYYRNAHHQRFLLFPARVWLKLSVASVFVASAILLLLILQHDFSNGYVYSYSDRSLPLHFLVSTFYAGQEGSFLFWALCSATIAIMLRAYTSTRKIESSVMAVYMGTFSFLLLLLVVKSPFKYVWEMFAGAPVNQVPADGRGLNPLLQNFWMVLHPPVLFVGFAAMAVPFSFAVAALWRRNYQEWVTQAFAWVLFAVCSLGMGLMLGAYWAYGVLGWGGYWGWDPVENSSLVPWITATALIHTMLVQRRSGKFVRTNVALATVSFFLVIYSTFLTRSGILGDASVHSFSDPGTAVYGLLILYLAAILLVGFGMMYVRRRELRAQATEVQWISRETALGAGAIVLILSAAVVLFGTSLPIVGKTTVEPAFYDQTNLPIAIAIGLLIGLSLFVQWGVDELQGMFVRAARSLGASLLFTGLLWVFGVRDWIMALFAFSSAFAFFVNVEIALRTAKGGWKLLGGKLAHLGLAVMFFGMIATGKYSSTRHLSLPLNTPQEALGYTFTYTGYHPTEDGKYAFHVVAEKEGKKFALAPLMFDAGEQGVMRNPDIASFLTKDIYLSPVSLDQANGQAAHGHETYTLPKGQTVALGDVKAKFVRFDMNAHANQAMMDGAQGMTIGSVLELSKGSASETIIPAMHYLPSGQPKYTPSRSKLIDGEVQLVAMNVGTGGDPSTVTVTIHRQENAAQPVETLVVEASIKPFVMLLWAGTVVMTLGFLVAIVKRAKEA
jgi:cytochrome c-type biogenesis protein CcmF